MLFRLAEAVGQRHFHQREDQRKHCGSVPTPGPDRHGTFLCIIAPYRCRRLQHLAKRRPCQDRWARASNASLPAGAASDARPLGAADGCFWHPSDELIGIEKVW